MIRNFLYVCIVVVVLREYGESCVWEVGGRGVGAMSVKFVEGYIFCNHSHDVWKVNVVEFICLKGI